jgi:hypothetical protein
MGSIGAQYLNLLRLAHRSSEFGASWTVEARRLELPSRTDPSGNILPGMKVRIPFVLTETDIDCTVILLEDLPAIRFLIETPAGDMMDPSRAAAAGAGYAVGTNMSYYRFTLPLPLGGKPAHAGVWHAVLQLDGKIFERYARASDQSFAAVAARMVHGVRYSVTAQANSNLRMHAAVAQKQLAARGYADASLYSLRVRRSS